MIALVMYFNDYLSPMSTSFASSASQWKYLRGQMMTVWGESTASELKLAIVADLDQGSKVEGSKKPQWRSIFKRGTLKRFKSADNPGLYKFTIEWESDRDLIGAIGEEGRGMELSELVQWQGRLYSFDDRTGIVYEILPTLTVVPRHILMEGDGDQSKGQKTGGFFFSFFLPRRGPAGARAVEPN